MFFRKFSFDRGGAKPEPATVSGATEPRGAAEPGSAPSLTAIPGGLSARSRPTPAHGLSLRTVDGRVDEVGLVLD